MPNVKKNNVLKQVSGGHFKNVKVSYFIGK